MSDIQIPFGMLFMEPANQDIEELIIPDYDPDEAISYVHDSAGRRVPYVNWARIYLGTKTGDNTKQILDPTDTDPGDD